TAALSNRRTTAVSCAVAWSFRLATLLAFWLAPRLVAAQACAGDCNCDSQVIINELIRGVNILLGNALLDTCPQFDTDGDGTVVVSELIAGVSNTLQGCPPTGLVQQGLTALACGNVDYANSSFESALAADPTDAQTSLLEIFTHVAQVLLDNQQL